MLKKLRNAARTGHVDYLKKVFKHVRKEHINAGTGQGLTALHWAAARGHDDIVEFLVKHGANPTLMTNSGKTAADLTRFRPVRMMLLHEERKWLDKTCCRMVGMDPLAAYDDYLSQLDVNCEEPLLPLVNVPSAAASGCGGSIRCHNPYDSPKWRKFFKKVYQTNAPSTALYPSM